MCRYLTYNLYYRSLTRRQRELLQEYADDVEGRSPTANAFSTTNHESQSSSKEPLMADHDNGTASSTHQSPSSGSWVFRTWQKLRGLIGF